MSMLSQRREVGEFRRRYKWMAFVVFLLFGVLAFRFGTLMLNDHEHYAQIAQRNITRRVVLPARRGQVYDARAQLLIGNRDVVDLFAVPSRLHEGHCARLRAVLGLDEAETGALERRLEQVPENRRDQLIRLISDLSPEQVAAVQTNLISFRDEASDSVPISLHRGTRRQYPYRALGAHLLGYLSEVQADELERLHEAGYGTGSVIGRTGIERAWEPVLRGRAGYRRSLRVRGVGPTADSNVDEEYAIDGHDLALTLDMRLMQAADRAFSGTPTGALAIVDVHTGAVLALYSKPSYDPALFGGRLDPIAYAELRDNPFRPLIDKSVYESFYPGSIFKPFTALAALEGEHFSASEQVECTQVYHLRNESFGCAHLHGRVDMRRALIESCNFYFYRLGETIGLDRIAAMATAFGLGEASGIGVNDEARGLIPTRAWYDARHIAWGTGYSVITAIGQGETRATVLQAAVAYAALANGGDLYTPYVVSEVRREDGTAVQTFGSRLRRHISVAPEHLALVNDSLVGVVNNVDGTAYSARIPNGVVEVAGKTGTAEVTGRIRAGEQSRSATYSRRAHAWFAGFAPARAPEVAIAVLVEHGGSGGEAAAPIATAVLDTLFRLRMAAEPATAPRP